MSIFATNISCTYAISRKLLPEHKKLVDAHIFGGEDDDLSDLESRYVQ